MKKQSLLVLLLLFTVVSLTTPAFSAEQQAVYGSQLMTEQERNEHRQRMRNARNEQEREKIRNEHHQRMKVRAREQGIELPDQPPARGGYGAGQGKGMGPGAGQGAGMGKGNR